MRSERNNSCEESKMNEINEIVKEKLLTLFLNCEFNGITLLFEKDARDKWFVKGDSFIRKTTSLSRNLLERLPVFIQGIPELLHDLGLLFQLLVSHSECLWDLLLH